MNIKRRGGAASRGRKGGGVRGKGVKGERGWVEVVDIK